MIGKLEFESKMLSLAACLPYADPDMVGEAFKSWLKQTPFSWIDGYYVCLDYVRMGHEVPFAPYLREIENKTLKLIG